MALDVAFQDAHQSDVPDPVSALQAMGYEHEYIERAINVHKKSIRGTRFDLSLLIDIISRLKVRDAANHKRPKNPPFKGHFDKIEDALKLQVDDAVDFRYENGRYIVCKVLSKTREQTCGHWVLLLHPLGEPLSVEKHNRYCTAQIELHRLAAPKSVSLRKLRVKSHPMSSVQIDDYVDINPLCETGPDQYGWTHGRIIKMDATSAQIKVVFFNEAAHRHEAQWVHLEDEQEVAPFKSKVVQQSESTQSSVDMVDSNQSIPSHSNVFEAMPSNDSFVLPRCASYSMGSHLSRHSMFSINSNLSSDSMGSPNAPFSPNSPFSPKYSMPTHQDIVSQLVAFGYRLKDVRNAMDSVSNPSDINEVMAYIAATAIIQSGCKPVEMPPMTVAISEMSEHGIEESEQETDDEDDDDDGDDDGDDHEHKRKESGVSGHSPSHSGSASSELYDEVPMDLGPAPMMSPYALRKRHTVTFSAASITQSLRSHSKSLSAMTISAKPFQIISPPPHLAKYQFDASAVLPSLPLSNAPSNESQLECGVFGVHPIKLPAMLFAEKDYGAPIPNILVKLKYELFMTDGQMEYGVFKKKADDDMLERIVRTIDSGKIEEIDFHTVNGVLTAQLISMWFDKLPQRILDDVDGERIEKCKSISVAGHIIESDIGEPLESYFKWLLDLCVDVTENEKRNGMSIKNMSEAIAPCLRTGHLGNSGKFVQLAILWRHFSK